MAENPTDSARKTVASISNPQSWEIALGSRATAIRIPLVAFIFSVLGLCAGCAVRRAASNQRYQLVNVGGADFLVPPAPGASNDALKEEISLGNLGQNAGFDGAADCSIHDPWFSFYRKDSGGWVTDLPLPAAWQRGNLYSGFRSQWNQFQDQLFDLQNKQCITPTAYFTAGELIAETVPVLANDALFLKYSFGAGGFVTLTSGMRLNIDRSIFRDTPGGAETVATYIGERAVYYQIVREDGNELGLKLTGIHNSSGLRSQSGKQFLDATLTNQFSQAQALRLFLFTDFVPTNERRTALLIGVKNSEELIRATGAITKKPEIPCTELVSSGIDCASLEGTVSMSVDMDVLINGKMNYFPIGSTVQSALNDVPKNKLGAVLKTLHVQRLFRGKYADVSFDPSSEAILKLTLFARDRISWKTSR
jgi:hypothetical protein